MVDFQTLILILMIIIAVGCITAKKNFTAVLCVSAISILATILYVLYRALDVALAEIVIGSAFIPLIFVITINKVSDFKVLDCTGDSFLSEGSTGYKIVTDICHRFNLNLKIISYDEEASINEAFIHKKDIDLVVYQEKGTEGYFLKGYKDSAVILRLSKMLQKYPNIYLVRVEEEARHE